MNITE